MELEELYVLAEKDLVIDKSDLMNASIGVSKIYARWLRYFGEEKKHYIYYDGKVNTVFRKRFNYYTTDFKLVLSKTEAEIYVRGDEEYVAANSRKRLSMARLEFIESTLKELSARSFHIKNAIEYMKFQQGER